MKFMDIQRLKEGYADGFVPGDLIVIQEKFDGSNAAARYDAETGKMVAFSRRHTLDQNNTLNGFYNYVQELNPEDYKDVPDYVIFGEWSGARNAIIYYPENTKKWYVFDIYDVREEKYLPQSEVKAFAETHGLTYINTFYVGPFVSWEHVQSFMDHPGYGEIQEGIVIKNQTRLNDPNSRLPFVVKIVGDKFHEVAKMNHVKKIQDPQKLQERTEAQELVKSVVTRRRVEKELYKMRDEGTSQQSGVNRIENCCKESSKQNLYRLCKRRTGSSSSSRTIFWKILFRYFDELRTRDYSRSDWSKVRRKEDTNGGNSI